VELCQLAQGVATQWGPEPPVDAVDELTPRRNALVFLQTIVPLASGAVEVEGRRRNLEVFRRAVGAEELLAYVQPRDGIVAAVILRELQLVARGRRLAERGCIVGVEATLFVQDLGLHVFTDAEMRLVSWQTAEISASMRLPRSPTILTSLSNMDSMEAWVAGV